MNSLKHRQAIYAKGLYGTDAWPHILARLGYRPQAEAPKRRKAKSRRPTRQMLRKMTREGGPIVVGVGLSKREDASWRYRKVFGYVAYRAWELARDGLRFFESSVTIAAALRVPSITPVVVRNAMKRILRMGLLRARAWLPSDEYEPTLPRFKTRYQGKTKPRVFLLRHPDCRFDREWGGLQKGGPTYPPNADCHQKPASSAESGLLAAERSFLEILIGPAENLYTDTEPTFDRGPPPDTWSDDEHMAEEADWLWRARAEAASGGGL